MIRGVHHYLCMFNSCQFVQTLKNCRSLTIDHVVHRHMCCAYWLELACSWQCMICLMAIALVLNEVDTIPRCLKNSGDMCIYIYYTNKLLIICHIYSELKYQLVLFSSPLSDISQNSAGGQLHVAAPTGSSPFQSLGAMRLEPWGPAGWFMEEPWISPWKNPWKNPMDWWKMVSREHPFFRDFVWENTQLASWNQP